MLKNSTFYMDTTETNKDVIENANITLTTTEKFKEIVQNDVA